MICSPKTGRGVTLTSRSVFVTQGSYIGDLSVGQGRLLGVVSW